MKSKVSKTIMLLLAVVALLAIAPSFALAELGAVKFFGGTGTQGGEFVAPGAMAINQNGTGGAAPGDLYVIDGARIQQLSASGEFIRAFGLDVGGPGVNVCTAAASCVAGTASAQAGALKAPDDIAIDQATGALYVTGNPNRRVDVFSAVGEFEGAFGWAVKVTGSAEELQFCTTASGCKAGSSGPGAGQFSESASSRNAIAVSPLNGHVLIADGGNWRVDEFTPTVEAGLVTGISFVRGYGEGAVTGASEFQTCTTVCHEHPLQESGPLPGEFTAPYPKAVAVDSSGKVYVSNLYHPNEGAHIASIQTFDPEGHFAGFFKKMVVSQVEDENNLPQDPIERELIERERSELFGLTKLKVNATSGHVLVGNNTAVGEYDSAGNRLGTILSEGQLFDDLAQAEGSGIVYLTISNQGDGVVALGEPVLPPAVSIEPVSTFTGTAAHFEGHVNPKGIFATYRFEYSSDGGVNWNALPQGSLPADSADHAVSADATGLEALTQYQVRLTATKLYNGGSAKAETTFTTAAAPPISGPTAATAISDSGTRLKSTINPENQATDYHFECVSQEHFEEEGYAGATEVPLGGETLQAAGKDVAVSQPVGGLEPTTTYHCRLTATNPAGTDTGLETTFTTYAGQAQGLPDGRVFEQATPIDKGGSDANGVEFLLRAAPDGSAVSYFINGGIPAGGGGQEFPAYVAGREGGGWQSHALLPDSSFGERVKVSGWSDDLKRDYPLVWNSGGTATFYEQNLASGEMTTIASGLSPYTGALYVGETPDGSRVLFESKSALAPEASEGVWNLYAWDRAGGSISLISLLPDESSPTSGAFAGAYHWGAADSKSGGANGSDYTQDLHVLSEDGSKAFFTTSNVNQLYVRKGIGTQSPTTVQVSASQKTNGSGVGGKDPKGPRKAAFMEATPDGRYVFFTSQEELTNDATTGSADQGNDLYRYDTESGQVIDLAPDTTDEKGAEVQGLLGSSVDGSYAYFAANGVLGEGASPGGCKSSPVTGWGGGGTCNIYLWHDGTISFVSRVSGTGGPLSTDGLNWAPTNYANQGFPLKSAHVSEDGKTLLFASTLSPTAYDSEGKNEFYRYDTEESLRCVSCNPTLAPPVADATLQNLEPGFTRPTEPNPFQIHSLSADGNRFFFQTPDKLVASDINGDDGCSTGGSIYACQDVYEWEANGTGSCESEAQDGGCLFLISTGESNEPAYFADASANGDNAFFFTRQSLVRQDTDQLYDIYDARVGGGIASQDEPPPPICEAEACKLGAPVTPASQSAGSASFAGPSDPKPNRKKKKHHARKHHKKARAHR